MTIDELFKDGKIIVKPYNEIIVELLEKILKELEKMNHEKM